MGAERRSMIISDEEKRVTAIHEAGHAVLTVRAAARGSDPQGHHHPARHGARRHAAAAGGREAQLLARLPERSHRHPARRPHRRRDHAAASITTGAGNDLERATEMARADGLRVGHERRDGSAHLRQEGRADLPRPRDRAALRTTARTRRSGSTRRSSASSPRTTSARWPSSRNTRSACRSWLTPCSRARCSTANRSKRIVAGLSIDDDSAGGPPEPPRAVSDDRTRKESRPGFVPNLHNPLPQPYRSAKLEVRSGEVARRAWHYPPLRHFHCSSTQLSHYPLHRFPPQFQPLPCSPATPLFGSAAETARCWCWAKAALR